MSTIELSKQPLAQRLAALWRWLTAPSAAIQGIAERRQARLLSSFLLVIIATFAAYHTISLLFRSNFRFTWPLVVGYLVLAGAYPLSRTQYSQVAAILSVSIFLLVPLLVILSGTGDNPALVLTFAIPSLLLGSILFSRRGALILVLVIILGILLMPLLAPGAIRFKDIAAPLGVTVMTSVLLLVAMVHRDEVEQEREAALRESEDRFRAIVENAPFGYYRVGLHGLWQYVNAQWERMHGYSRDEVIGRSFEITQPEEAKEQARDLVRRGLSGERIAGEFGRSRKDGQVEYHSYNVQPVYHKGEVVAIEGFISDITQRRRAEQALRQANWVIENSPVMLFRWKNAEGWPVELVSENVTQLGYTAEELLSGAVPYATMVHPEDLERVAQEVQAYSSDGVERFEQEYRVLTKEGAVRWVDDRTVIERDAQGRVTHYQGILMDITQRKRAEMEIKKLNEELFTLQSIGGAIATSLDVRYVLDTVSRGMAGLLDVESCFFSEWDKAADTYYDIAAYAPVGWRGDEPEPEAYQLADYPLTREVLVERRPAQMTVSQPDINPAELAYMRKAKIKTFMMLPMVYQGQSIGLVDVEDSRVERTFAEQEVALAQMLANQAANAIQNARLYQQAQQELAERVRTEKALRESEERYRSFAQNFQGIAYRARVADWTADFVDGAVEQITGYTKAEFEAGEPSWYQLIHPDDLPNIADSAEKILRIPNYTTEREYRILRKDGGTRWILELAGNVCDDTGQPVFVQGALHDITTRVRAEEALRESETRFRTLVEQIPNSVTYMAALDETSTTLYISPQVVDILGYGLEEYQADPDLWAGAIHPADYDRVMAELARCHQAGERLDSEYRIFKKDGQLVWFHDVADIVRDDDNNPLYLLGVNTDVTDRKRAEGEQDALIAELEARNVELERFTYTVSHDLKSPLITIQGFLGFLEQDAIKGDVEQTQADIARISNAADKMQRLLDELLELSRIGRIVNPPEAVPLTELGRETVDLLSGRLTERGVAVHIEPDLPLIHGDRQRLREVLENLVDNAVKFMGDQPEPLVEIGARQDGAETVIYVRDNGVGIDPRYQDKVFGLFEKLDAGTEGSGIGLAIIRRIVEVHGGRVWVESEGVGQGSAFCFTLPEGDGSTG